MRHAEISAAAVAISEANQAMDFHASAYQKLINFQKSINQKRSQYCNFVTLDRTLVNSANVMLTSHGVQTAEHKLVNMTMMSDCIALLKPFGRLSVQPEVEFNCQVEGQMVYDKIPSPVLCQISNCELSVKLESGTTSLDPARPLTNGHVTMNKDGVVTVDPRTAIGAIQLSHADPAVIGEAYNWMKAAIGAQEASETEGKKKGWNEIIMDIHLEDVEVILIKKDARGKHTILDIQVKADTEKPLTLNAIESMDEAEVVRRFEILAGVRHIPQTVCASLPTAAKRKMLSQDLHDASSTMTRTMTRRLIRKASTGPADAADLTIQLQDRDAQEWIDMLLSHDSTRSVTQLVQ